MGGILLEALVDSVDEGDVVPLLMGEPGKRL